MKLKVVVTLSVLLGCARVFAQEAPLDAGTLPEEDAAPQAAEDAAPQPEEDAAQPAVPAEELDAGVELAPAPLFAPDAALPPLPPARDRYGARARLARPAGPGETELHGTGSRMNIPLRELPATVSVVDQQQLRERGVVDLQQALGLMSGVMPTWQYGAFQNVRVRGFQAMNLFDGRRDARSLIADSAPMPGLYDVERVELLRGPSSVLYGYGAVGGVVNMIRKRPSQRASYELELGLGLPNQRRAHVGAQGPLGSMFSYRVDLAHVTHENYRGARTERNQLTAAVRFAPNRRHTLNVRLAYSIDQYNTDVGVPTVESSARPGVWVLPAHARLSNYYGSRSDHMGYDRLEATADYRFDITESTYLEARGAVTRDHYDYLAAESLNYVPGTDGMRGQVEREFLYFERGWTPMMGQLELHSQQRTGPIEHRLMAGYQLDRFGGLSYRGNTGGITPAPVDYAFPVDRTPRVGSLLRTGADRYRQLTHGIYAFDHMKWRDLILTGGARFDSFRNYTRRYILDSETGESIVDPNTGEFRRRNTQQNNRVTGQVGLVYTPISLLTLYTGYANSFMPRIVFPSQQDNERFKPELSQQIEGGLRVRLEQREHVLELDAAAYLIAKRNVVIPRGPDRNTQAGKISSRGLDLNANYSAPRIVQLTAGYSLTAAQFDDYVSADPISGDNVSRKGNEVDFAPRHSGNTWLRLLLSRRMGAGVGARYMGKQFADPENRLPLPRYALLDASVWFGAGRATFTVSANNLLDERMYFTSSINSWAVNPQVTPGPGREILGTLRLEI